VISSEHGSGRFAVRTPVPHRPCGQSAPQQACPGDLTDCFCALLEGEDLEEVFFEFLVPAERPE
jgi:hypothetical protein